MNTKRTPKKSTSDPQTIAEWADGISAAWQADGDERDADLVAAGLDPLGNDPATIGDNEIRLLLAIGVDETQLSAGSTLIDHAVAWAQREKTRERIRAQALAIEQLAWSEAMTQGQIASKHKVNVRTVSRWIKGETPSPIELQKVGSKWRWRWKPKK